jgi:hypothetical protein
MVIISSLEEMITKSSSNLKGLVAGKNESTNLNYINGKNTF